MYYPSTHNNQTHTHTYKITHTCIHMHCKVILPHIVTHMKSVVLIDFIAQDKFVSLMDLQNLFIAKNLIIAKLITKYSLHVI